jgi:hypothetical protein
LFADIIALEEEYKFLSDRKAIAVYKVEIASICDELLLREDIKNACVRVGNMNAPQLGFEVDSSC